MANKEGIGSKCVKRDSFLNKEIKRDSVKSLVEMV